MLVMIATRAASRMPRALFSNAKFHVPRCPGTGPATTTVAETAHAIEKQGLAKITKVETGYPAVGGQSAARLAVTLTTDWPYPDASSYSTMTQFRATVEKYTVYIRNCVYIYMCVCVQRCSKGSTRMCEYQISGITLAWMKLECHHVVSFWG